MPVGILSVVRAECVQDGQEVDVLQRLDVDFHEHALRIEHALGRLADRGILEDVDADAHAPAGKVDDFSADLELIDDEGLVPAEEREELNRIAQEVCVDANTRAAGAADSAGRRRAAGPRRATATHRATATRGTDASAGSTAPAAPADAARREVARGAVIAVRAALADGPFTAERAADAARAAPSTERAADAARATTRVDALEEPALLQRHGVIAGEQDRPQLPGGRRLVLAEQRLDHSAGPDLDDLENSVPKAINVAGRGGRLQGETERSRVLSLLARVGLVRRARDELRDSESHRKGETRPNPDS
jgi:hypothetical protein